MRFVVVEPVEQRVTKIERWGNLPIVRMTYSCGHTLNVLEKDSTPVGGSVMCIACGIFFEGAGEPRQLSLFEEVR